MRRPKRPQRREEDDAQERRPRKRKRKKSNTGLWIGLGVGGAVLLVAGVVLIIVISGTKERPTASPAAVADAKPAAEPAARPEPAPAPDAVQPEPDPNAGLSGLARVWTEQETKNRLRDLGLAYMASNRPPKMFKDLELKDPRLEEAINKGWIQVAWGTDIRRLPQGTTNTILAYERDPDRVGLRWALFADGGVGRVDAAELEQKKVKGK